MWPTDPAPGWPPAERPGASDAYWNLLLSMRSSTVQVPVPLEAEFTCHWIPMICVGVAIDEFEGLLNSVNPSVYVVAVAVGTARLATVG